MKRRTLYTLVAVIVVLGLTGWAMAGKGQEVSTIKAELGTISRQVEETAIVQPVNEEKIYASQNARVTSLTIAIGQRVTQGQILFKLENPDLGIQISETRSRLAQADAAITAARIKVNQLNKELIAAQTDLQRITSLYQQKVVSKDEYEKAVLEALNAEAELRQQKSILTSAQAEEMGLSSQLTQLNTKNTQLDIVSPINGTILELPVKSAQSVTNGSLLVTIGSAEQLELKADILSDDLADLKVGQTVTVSSPVLASQKITGRVVKIYPRAEEKMSALGVIQRRVPVIIEVTDKANLQPGYEVRAAIETNRLDQVLILPVESVRSLSEQDQQVMLVRDGRVIIQKVKTGASDQNHIQIISGLQAGDMVVRDANLDLKPNSRVKVLAE